MQKDWDFLPGMKRWNGQPFYDFLKVWFLALTVALGSLVQDGNSLLECAEGSDVGSDAGRLTPFPRRGESRFRNVPNPLCSSPTLLGRGTKRAAFTLLIRDFFAWRVGRGPQGRYMHGCHPRRRDLWLGPRPGLLDCFEPS